MEDLYNNFCYRIFIIDYVPGSNIIIEDMISTFLEGKSNILLNRDTCSSEAYTTVMTNERYYIEQVNYVIMNKIKRQKDEFR